MPFVILALLTLLGGLSSEPVEIRAITYNIHSAHPLAKTPAAKARAGLVLRADQMLDRLALELRLYRPNIVALQEAASEKRVKELARRLGMRYAYFRGGWTGKGWPEGISGALLTTFDIVEQENCPVDGGGERPDGLYSRFWGRALLDTGHEKIAVHAAHLLPSWKNTTHIRLGEIAGIVKVVERDLVAGHSVIVMGDMNHAPGTEEFAAWAGAGLVDTYRPAEGAPAMTCPADVPTERIDYVFCRGPIAERIREGRVLFEGAFRTNPADPSSFALSDHVPVLAVFR